MASPRPQSHLDPPPAARRKESTADRERVRDGGRGERPLGRDTTGSTAGGVKVAADEEDRIGPYLIGEEIGRGSFATVFKGARYVRPFLTPPRTPPLPHATVI